VEATKGKLQGCEACQMSHRIFADGSEGWIHHGTQASNGSIPWEVAGADGSRPSYRPQSIKQLNRQPDAFQIERTAQTHRGYNVALKPAYEPIIVARKPFKSSVAANVLEWGTGAINVDACRVETVEELRRTVGGFAAKSEIFHNDEKYKINTMETNHPQGRWPANVIHDGSDEVVRLFPSPHGAGAACGQKFTRGENTNVYGAANLGANTGARHGDTGSAARFFYTAKASKADRDEGCEGMELRGKNEVYGNGLNTATKLDPKLHTPESVAARPQRHNHHPTVKPTALMRYLVRLVTPPGGVTFDPFMGSGSTGKAAVLEGFSFTGCDTEEEYVEIARKRIEFARQQLRMEL